MNTTETTGKQSTTLLTSEKKSADWMYDFALAAAKAKGHPKGSLDKERDK